MSEIESTSAAPAESGPDLNAIADRLFGKSSVPSTAAASPSASDVQAARQAAAAEAQKARGAEINAATTATKADDARKASFAEHGLWKPDDATPVEVKVPQAIADIRAADSERRMYKPEKTYSGVQVEAAMPADVDPTLAPAIAKETREIFADLGAGTQEAQELIDTITRFSAEPMTPERDAANVNEAINALNREFGEDAANALKAARQLVQRDPRLAAVLDQSRLGNDPATIIKVAHLARSQRARGKL